MSGGEGNLGRWVRLALAADAVGEADHPRARTLAEFQLGRLRPRGAEEVAAHLEGCRECASLSLDLEDLGELPANAKELPVPRPLAWARFADRLRQEARQDRSPLPDAAPPLPPELPLQGQRPSRAWLAAAAILVMATGVGGLGLGWRLAGGGERGARPVAGIGLRVVTLDLFPVGALRGTEATPLPLPRPVDTVVLNLMVLNLMPSSAPSPEDYAVRVLHSGDEIWKERGLRLNPRGYFSISLRGSQLQRGTYTFEVRSGDGIDVFHLRVSDRPLL